MKKRDYIILITIFICILGFYYIWKSMLFQEGTTVEISINNSVVAEIPNDTDVVIGITQTGIQYYKTVEAAIENGAANVLVIENGKANMRYANCPDKICVNMHQIDKKGQSIVCMPNRIVIMQR